MKRLSGFSHDGFISAYFLSVLLYCSAFLTVMVKNDQARLLTVMNMRENDLFFRQEAAVAADIQCRLMNDRLEDGIFETAGYQYHLEVQERRIYAELLTDHPETLNIVYDAKKKVLLDLSGTRP